MLTEHARLSTTPIADCGLRPWSFTLAEGTASSCWKSPLESTPTKIEEVALSFMVSRDEEYVQLLITSPRTIDLGPRAHHYLLLTLARHRLADAARGIPEAACGWIHIEKFAHDPSMAPGRMNIDVFRIRKQFGRCGLADATKIVERRRPSRQIRIGTVHVSITQV